ncbi:MAG TPA: M13 family metallopeptidase [Candidatus Paceibacterota bacterium]|nr:M13 family metallopeptidase [Candidatus Paceibacterota bacterium]
MAKRKWGFDTTDLDTNVRPQDDFYKYANGGWMKANTIPHDEAMWGTFQMLRKRTEHQIKAILDELMRKRAKSGTPEQIIGDFFRSGMDAKRRNALGMRPLLPLLEKIRGIEDRAGLFALINELHQSGLGVPWGAVAGQDDKKSDANILHLYQDGLGMPDRDYYLKDDAESKRVRAAYQRHLARMFALLGESSKTAAASAATVYALEERLAKASMRKEDRRNPDKVYNKMSSGALKKLAPGYPWAEYFTAIGAPDLRSLNVMQPQFVRAAASLLKAAPLENWKTYLMWHVASDAAPYLSEEFEQANFDFYGTVLSGQRQMKAPWRRVLAVVNGSLGEELGKLYVKKHFPPEAKRAIDELVSNLFAAFCARLAALDWMSPATKRAALAKLAKMDRKIGYPKRWKTYRGLAIKPGDYFGNVLRSARFEQRRNIKKLKKPVDRSEWFMYPQTVNAYYNPGTNEIAFPAAILQPPYFGPDQDAGINYGAIGGVIGHEITHGFDNDGSKYDARGNLRKWWTPADRKRFERKAALLKRQFDRYELHGLKVNGKLTLGENIADLGGYAIALDAYRKHLEKNPAENASIGSFTPVQRFFLGMAQDWRELVRPEAEKTLILTNEHAPHELRTNGPASNLPQFYAAWNVKKGDKLYRAPRDRAKIW